MSVTVKEKSHCFNEIVKTAWDMTEESIREQRSDLRNLRNQAAIIIAVNGLIASFSTGILLKVKYIDSEAISVNTPILLAIICFVASLCFSLRILVSTNGWKFDISAATLIEKFGCRGKDFIHSEFLEKASQVREKHRCSNERLLSGVQRNLFFGVSCAVSQLAFWLFDLI